MTDRRAAFAERLVARLHPPGTDPESLPVAGFRPPGGLWRPRPAAVLIPIIDGVNELEVLLTVRSDRLPEHAGQVAFPGGGVDAGDDFPLGTALREAEEEIGLPSGQVTPLGLLDRFDTITGYRIVPVVGLVTGQPGLKPCSREVQRIFSWPLSEVTNAGNYRQHTGRRDGVEFDFLSIGRAPALIWGATAAILDRLRLVLHPIIN